MNRLGFVIVAIGVSASLAGCSGYPQSNEGSTAGHYQGGSSGYNQGYDRRYDGVADSTAYGSGYDRGVRPGYTAAGYQTPYQNERPQYDPAYRIGDMVPGRFAVYLQEGAWDTKVRAQGDRCTGPRFRVALERLYQPTARKAFVNNFDQVVFTDRPLSPEEIAAGGFDGHIVINQGSVDIAFITKEDFFTDSISAYVAVEGNVAVVGARGLVRETHIEGAGRGTTDAVLCSDAEGAIADAANGVLYSFLVKVIEQAKDDIRSMRRISQRAAPSAG